MTDEAKKRKKYFTDDERKFVCEVIWDAQSQVGVAEYAVQFTEGHKQERDRDGDPISAQIRVSPTYLSATIRFFPDAIARLRENKEEFIKIVYHEIAHLVVDPIYLDTLDGLCDLERHYQNILREQAVEKLSRLGLAFRELKEKVNKKA